MSSPFFDVAVNLTPHMTLSHLAKAHEITLGHCQEEAGQSGEGPRTWLGTVLSCGFSLSASSFGWHRSGRCPGFKCHTGWESSWHRPRFPTPLCTTPGVLQALHIMY